MEPSAFLFSFIGAIDLILAIGFIYYAFKNAIKLKGAITQYLMVVGASFFVISGVFSIIGIFIFYTSSIVRYLIFIIGFLFILAGEIYWSSIVESPVDKKPWLIKSRTFSHIRYRFSGILVILFFTIPSWTLSMITEPTVIYGMVASFSVMLSFVLLMLGERKLYVMTNVFLDKATLVDKKDINLLRNDVAAVRIYFDIINTFLYFGKPVVSKKIVNDTLNKWSEEHPVLFENCLPVGGNKIDARVVIKNLDRVYAKSRLSLVLKEFSALTARLVSFYSYFTSSEYAKEKLAECYKVVKEQYRDTPIIFDILRTMPDGVLEMEKLCLLNREELELKVKERTTDLVNANKELQTEVTKRKKAESQIRTSLKEKEMLLKEIHHRVKNNLQIISSLLALQSEHIKEKWTLEMFKESQNRIKSMSFIHEQLYQSQDLANIDFNEYIQNITVNLFHSYGVNSDNISLKINAKDVSLSINKAIPCGLIINELVSNALKHAFAGVKKGEIRIDFHSDDDNKFILIVSDNGGGFPKDLDFRSVDSLGLRLVNTLTKQLKGTIELDRTHGTIFKITFADWKIGRSG